MNITEDYCSFEIAKLLKEKGFDWRTQYVYTLDGTGSTPPKIGNWRAKSNIQKPTHQMTMKWLREQGIECVVIPIWNTLGKQYRSYVLSDLGDRYKDNYDSYSDNISYEKAVEAALKYSLENLI